MNDTPFWITFSLLPLLGGYLSILHGVVSHTTHAEIEELRPRHPNAAALLEKCREDRDNTIASLDTLFIATAVATAVLTGVFLGLQLVEHGDAGIAGDWRVWVLGGLAAFVVSCLLSLLFDLMPRKLGAHARRFWQPRVGPGLRAVRLVGKPVRKFARLLDRFAPPPDPGVDSSDEEIRQLASKRAREGTLTEAESTLVSNAVRLDDIPVKQILTPRPVVTSLDASWSIADVFKIFPNLPHGRFPVYEGSHDKIVGIVRRRDLLKAKVEHRDGATVRDFLLAPHFVPENATVSAAMHDLVKNHHQLAIVVDEFGNFSGVATLEDVFESLLGVEIFEKDDVAVDMREFARTRDARAAHGPRGRPDSPASPPRHS